MNRIIVISLLLIGFFAASSQAKAQSPEQAMAQSTSNNMLHLSAEASNGLADKDSGKALENVSISWWVLLLVAFGPFVLLILVVGIIVSINDRKKDRLG
jgi:hypothetical protein